MQFFADTSRTSCLTRNVLTRQGPTSKVACTRFIPDRPGTSKYLSPKEKKPGRGRVIGKRWSKNYLSKILRNACINLGIEGINMYVDTRRRTAKALGKTYTPKKSATQPAMCQRHLNGISEQPGTGTADNIEGQKVTDQYRINVLGGRKRS